MASAAEPTNNDAQSSPPKNAMDRFIDGIELIAAFFVGIVAVNTFVAVVMRKFFAVTIPDYYDFGRLLLGILIFWGIAATSYRGTHITVDLVWANASPKYQRLIDIFHVTQKVRQNPNPKSEIDMRIVIGQDFDEKEIPVAH